MQYFLLKYICLQDTVKLSEDSEKFVLRIFHVNCMLTH